jgi:transcription elongation factor Elf1
MKINCLSCGHNVDLSEAYENYSGSVKCYVCGALLDIRAEDGDLKSVKLASSLTTRPAEESPP